MKKIICFAALAATLLFSAGCKKDNQPEDKGKEGLEAPVLTVNTQTAILGEDDTEVLLNFSWQDVVVPGITPKYVLQVTYEGDTGFTAGTSYDTEELSKRFSAGELRELVSELGKTLPVSLVFRVRATAEGVEAVVSNLVTVKVSEPEVVIEHIYPIGEATPWGWSLDSAEEMTGADGVFTWTGKLIKNAEFKFVTQKDWWPGLVRDATSTDPFAMVYSKTEKVGDVNMDNKFKVDKTGEYKLTIDAKSIYALKLTAELIREIEITVDINEIYILGSATTTGWSLNAMQQFTKNGDIYTLRCVLMSDGEFRFPLQKEDNKWWPCLVMGENESTLAVGLADGDNNPFHVAEDGVYDITIDASTLSITITLTDIDINDFASKVEINELYVLGDACDAGWSLDNMVAFTKNGDIFTWEGNLKASGEFRFPLQKVSNQWWPCLVMGSTEGTLKVANSDGENNPLHVAEDGNYQIVVNAAAMTYTITKK